MNIDICKKCFELHHNVIQSILLSVNNNVHGKKNLYIKGLLHLTAFTEEQPFICMLHNVEFNKNNIDINNEASNFFCTESDQRKIMEIVKPNKDCAFYSEQLMHQWNNPEENKNEI